MDKFSLAFSISNIGPKRFQQLLAKFGTPQDAWKGSKQEFETLDIKQKTYETFDKFRKTFDIDKYLKNLEKEKVEFISFLDPKYPVSFKELDNPPIGVFCKGNLGLLNCHPLANRGSRSLDSRVYGNDDGNLLKIAVVGTRKITTYGKNVTESIVSELVLNGVCIVSGLALGVDGCAHRVTLENHGKTIAFLACGVNCCLPSEHQGLYSNILQNDGLIISEYPLSVPPNKGTFLARNRLIAAFSDGVLVTEAAEDSGSLVTAEWGLKLNKKIFAVPGQITSKMSDGSLKLLKKGAKLVTNEEDILEEFKLKKSKVKNIMQKFQGLNKDERIIIDLLEAESLALDEIASKSKINVADLFVSLSNLELKRIIKNTGGKISLNVQN